MRYIFRVLTFLLLMSTSCFGETLKQLSLDDATALGLTIQNDYREKTEGQGSIKITTKWPTTICLEEVVGPNVTNAMLVYQAKVKTDLEGLAFLELWAQIADGQYFSRGMNNPIAGQSDWKLIQTPFVFREGQKPDKVTLNLVINGKGTVWVDDVRLSKEPLR